MRHLILLVLCCAILLGLGGCSVATSSSASTSSPSGAKINIVSDVGMVSLSQNSAKDVVAKTGSRTFTITADRVNLGGDVFCPLPEGVQTIDISLSRNKLTILADGQEILEE